MGDVRVAQDNHGNHTKHTYTDKYNESVCSLPMTLPVNVWRKGDKSVGPVGGGGGRRGRVGATTAGYVSI